MKLPRLLQLFILFTTFLSLIGNNSRVHASMDMSQNPSVTTSVTPSSIERGETALVTVNMNHVPVDGYTAAEFTCTYGTLLEGSNIVVTNLFGANAITAINGPKDGKFILAIAGNKGNRAIKSGTAFTFNIKGMFSGWTSIDCVARVSNGHNVLFQLPSIATSFTVLGGPPTEAPVTSTVPSPTACDRAEFIADVTIPSGTVVMPGETFTKTWRLKNIGTCVWNMSYGLVFYNGDFMTPSTTTFPENNVVVGQTVDISVTLTAPLTAGLHHTNWMISNASGELFGIGPQWNQPFAVNINVSGPTVTPVLPTITNTPTNTPTGLADTPTPTTTLGPNTPRADDISPTPSKTPGGPTPTPIAGIVFDFVANACAGIWTNGTSQLPCPGTEGSASGFVRKVNNPKLEMGVTDLRAGLLTVPSNTNNGFIQGIYPAFKVQSGDHFRSMIGCENNALDCYVIFRLDYLVAGSSQVYTFWAFAEKYDGQNYTTDIDLSSLAGQDIKFALTVLSMGSPLDDRALWVDPIIYRTNTSLNPALSSNSALTGQGFAKEPVTVTLLQGDIDGNNIIDQFDALTIGMNYNKSSPIAADLNNDGTINLLDLQLLAANYQKSGLTPWQ